ncbi:MAG: hypothetical protein WDM92_01865 [Caulobacteraceae bacterium]
MAKWKTAAACAAGLACAALAPAAWAQDAAGTPPSWDTLTRCAQTVRTEERLACYDAAMRAAGYAPKPEAVAAEKRRVFGLSVPLLNSEKHAEAKTSRKQEKAAARAPEPATVAAEDDNGAVTVQISRVAMLYGGKMLFVTTDGALWQQTDTETVEPLPTEGQSMQIRRTRFGGYFCDVSKWKTVRCVRLK